MSERLRGRVGEQPEGPSGGLQRALGPVQVTASGVGIIIGAGIYVLLGAATAEAGAGVWLAFVVAAVLSGLTAMSYAELSAMFPTSSAEYEYTRQVAPSWVAFVVGWMMIAGMIIATAAVALGFASYTARFLDLPQRPVALALLAVEAAIAAAGIGRSAAVSTVLSLVQVGGLLFVIVIGMPHVGTVGLLDGVSVGGVTAAATLVFFAFIGFDEVITLAEETRDPTRVVPRALLGALAISTLLYVAVAIAAVSVLGPEALAASPRPLADVMAHSLGARAADVVTVIAALSTFNTSPLALTAASRLFYGIGNSGALPRRLTAISPRTHAPASAIVVSAVAAGCFVLAGDIAVVAGVTDFAIYVVFIAVNSAVIILRYRRPDLERPFRSPGAIGRLPVLPVLGLITVAVLAPRLALAPIVLGIAVLAAGALAWLAAAASHRRSCERPSRECPVPCPGGPQRTRIFEIVSLPWLTTHMLVPSKAISAG